MDLNISHLANTFFRLAHAFPFLVITRNGGENVLLQIVQKVDDYDDLFDFLERRARYVCLNYREVSKLVVYSSLDGRDAFETHPESWKRIGVIPLQGHDAFDFISNAMMARWNARKGWISSVVERPRTGLGGRKKHDLGNLDLKKNKLNSIYQYRSHKWGIS